MIFCLSKYILFMRNFSEVKRSVDVSTYFFLKENCGGFLDLKLLWRLLIIVFLYCVIVGIGGMIFLVELSD